MMEEQNPWTILGEKLQYDNPWIRVTEYDVRNPSGGKGIYGKVHFKNLAIGIFPLDESGFTWLVGQYRFPLNRYSWEMPEGGGPAGEDPLEAARRELREETGLLASEWSLLLEMHLSNSVSDEQAFIFLARDLEQADAQPEETEALQIRKLHFSEVLDLVNQGVITDSMTVAAVLKIQIMVLNGQISFQK